MLTDKMDEKSTHNLEIDQTLVKTALSSECFSNS